MKLFRKTAGFFNETITELKKASWPTRQELVFSTTVVIVAIFMLGIYVSMVDFSLYQVVQLLNSWVRF